MTNHLRLAERVEQSAGADDDLDREIWLSVVADDSQRELVRVGRSMHGDDEAAFRIDRMMDGLCYTSSLDAALTLVPEGWHVGFLTECDEDDSPYCCLTQNEDPCVDVAAHGATMTLALCAAALKAHAQAGEDK